MEVFASNEHALLPGFEAEAVAHFQEKLLKVIKQRVFEIGLAHSLLGAEAEDLEDVGIADDLSGLEGFCTCVGDGRELGFFFGKSAALVNRGLRSGGGVRGRTSCPGCTRSRRSGAGFRQGEG